VALLAALVVLAAGDTLRWTADVATQGRGLEEPDAGQHARVAEILLSGHFGLLARSGEESAAFSVSPRLLVREGLRGQPPDTGNSMQHGGRLDLESRVAPTTRLGLRSTADWGVTDFSPVVTAPVPGGTGLLPRQRFVRTLTLDVTADVHHHFSRRLDFVSTAGVQRSGGLGEEAVAVIPIQRGFLGTASLAWTADRDTQIALQANGSATRFSLGRDSLLSEMQAVWTDRPSRQVRSDVSAGAALIHTEGDGVSEAHAYGSGAAGLRWDLPLSPRQGLSTAVHGRLLPAIDRLTGLAVQSLRGDGTAELVDGPRRFGIGASGGRALSGVSAGAEDVRLDARVSWALSPAFVAEAAYVAAWTNQPPFLGWQKQVYVGFRWAGAGAL